MSSQKRRLAVSSPYPVAMKEIQLIDRVDEMQVLRDAVDKATRGEGGVVFLHGEAGIGKTRLARELGAYARSRGMQVLSGRCPALFKLDGVPPYVLWNEVIRNYLENCNPEQLYRVVGFYPIEISRLVPELKQKLRTLPESFPLNPEHSRDRLFEAVSQFVTNISRETPLLVVLDDLQWTDQSSLLLMHYLARSVYKESLLLLGAYRDTDIDEGHSLSQVLTELNRERLLRDVPLKRMSFDDVSEMIKQILGQEDIEKEFSQLIYEKTRGNPFFVEEVVKSLKEEQVIYQEGNKWEIKGVSEVKFPETVRSVIKKRISRLDDESQQVLTTASFLGKDFTFEALKGATGTEEDKLLEIMETMLKTGLLKEGVIREEDVYSFADIIVRDVVYEEVSRLRRRRLHSVIGIALEKVYAERIDEHYGELAYHFLESGDKDKALNYFLKAREKAQYVYALDEAFSYAKRALDLLEQKGDSAEEKARLTETLGDLKGWMGESDVGLEYLSSALAQWSQLGDKRNVARLHAKTASWLWLALGDKDRASEHHRIALEILEKEPKSLELAGLYEDISHMLWRTGEHTEAFSWAQKAFELAKRFGDPDILAGCYNDLGTLSLKSGEFQKAREYYEQGLKIALESKVEGYIITMYNNLSELYGITGEFQKEFEIALKGSEFAREVGSLYGSTWLDSALAECYMNMGEMQKAISIYDDVLALAKRTRHLVQISGSLSNLGRCYRLLGEWDRSLQHLMEALDIARKTEEYQFSGEITLELGELFMEMEDYAEADEYLQESNNIYQKAEDTDAQLTETFPALSRLYLRQGKIEEAKALVEKTSEYAIRTKNKLDIHYAEMLKGMLFREQRNWEQSMELFEKSLQGYKSLDAQKWYVHELAGLLYEYGLVYLNRNEEGDKQKAHSLLDQALETWKKVGAEKKIEKAVPRMVYAETPGRVVRPESSVSEARVVAPPDCVSTGYEDLDNLLMGGIPRNYSVIMTSSSCDERDLLVKRFLERGVERGEVTFYVTIDPGELKSAAENSPNLYLFVCNPQADAIIKSLPNVSKLRGVENLTDISIALNSAFHELDTMPNAPRRACIEIVSDILLQHHAVQTRRWLTGITAELKSRAFTTLAVMNTQMHPPEEVQAVLDLFEGELNIYDKTTEKGLEKFLIIKKMHNRKYSKGELRLREGKLQ